MCPYSANLTPLPAGVRIAWRREAFYGPHKGQNDKNSKNSFASAIMSGSGLACSIVEAQQQREVARRGLEQQLFVDIPNTANIQPVHATGIELMREVALDFFSSLGL